MRPTRASLSKTLRCWLERLLSSERFESERFHLRESHPKESRLRREDYGGERLLISLATGVRHLDSTTELACRVGKGLLAALHPKRICVYFRDLHDADFALEYSSDEGAGSRLSEDSQVVRHADSITGPQLIRSERDALLVIPIRTPDGQLMGFVHLGEKQGGERYSPGDNELLLALSAQIGLFCENISLRNRIEEEKRVRNEVLVRLEHGGMGLMKECRSCGRCYEHTAETCPRDASPVTWTLPIERTIDAKYRLDRSLGRGGMGAVYEAMDLRLRRRVSVKVMTGAFFGEARALRRFEAEACALARLRHSSIVAIHDYGELANGGAYLVMELLSGRTLREEIQRRGAIDPMTTAAWFDEIFEGMKAAHRAGVIHRDLKPENIFLSEDSGIVNAKVLDFGLAKTRSTNASNSARLTRAGAVMGTRAYMSPEQLAGEDVDERTDVYALGVMVIEALSGQNPFREPDRRTSPASPSRESLFPDASDAIASLNRSLRQCLAYDLSQRTPSVVAMQETLIPLIRLCPARPSLTELEGGFRTSAL